MMHFSTKTAPAAVADGRATLRLPGDAADDLLHAVVTALREAIAGRTGDPHDFIGLYRDLTDALKATPSVECPVDLVCNPIAVVEAIRRRIVREGGLAGGYDTQTARLAMQAHAAMLAETENACPHNAAICGQDEDEDEDEPTGPRM